MYQNCKIMREDKSMAKHFISILGTSKYDKTMYYFGEGDEKKQYETAYVQEAILKLKFDEWNDGDRITVFVTEDSKKNNWDNREFTDKEKTNAVQHGQMLPEIHQGLREILEKDYKEYMDDIEKCVISIGSNDREMWDIFQAVYARIKEEDELYIDITHALRHLPVLMLSVVTFARTVKRAAVGGIYYGAYEAKRKNEMGIEETQIFDLIPFLDILDWSQAAASFVKYGSSDQILDLYQKSNKRLPGKTGELKKVINELQNITLGLETARGYCRTEGLKEKEEKAKESNGTSVLESYYSYKGLYKKLQSIDEEQGDIRNQQKNMIKPLGELMGVIDEKIRVFDVESNLDLGLAAVKWAIDHERIQQGFTALDETITTFLCVSYKSYGIEEGERSDRVLCKSVSNEIAKYMQNEKVSKLTDKDRENICERWKKYYNTKKEEDYAKGCQVIMKVPEELVKIGKKVSEQRNSMNHFGYSKGKDPAKTLKRNLEKDYNEFVACKKQMEEMKSHG